MLYPGVTSHLTCNTRCYGSSEDRISVLKIPNFWGINSFERILSWIQACYKVNVKFLWYHFCAAVFDRMRQGIVCKLFVNLNMWSSCWIVIVGRIWSHTFVSFFIPGFYVGKELKIFFSFETLRSFFFHFSP